MKNIMTYYELLKSIENAKKDYEENILKLIFDQIIDNGNEHILTLNAKDKFRCEISIGEITSSVKIRYSNSIRIVIDNIDNYKKHEYSIFEMSPKIKHNIFESNETLNNKTLHIERIDTELSHQVIQLRKIAIAINCVADDIVEKVLKLSNMKVQVEKI